MIGRFIWVGALEGEMLGILCLLNPLEVRWAQVIGYREWEQGRGTEKLSRSNISPFGAEIGKEGICYIRE